MAEISKISGMTMICSRVKLVSGHDGLNMRATQSRVVEYQVVDVGARHCVHVQVRTLANEAFMASDAARLHKAVLGRLASDLAVEIDCALVFFERDNKKGPRVACQALCGDHLRSVLVVGDLQHRNAGLLARQYECHAVASGLRRAAFDEAAEVGVTLYVHPGADAKVAAKVDARRHAQTAVVQVNGRVVLTVSVLYELYISGVCQAALSNRIDETRVVERPAVGN